MNQADFEAMVRRLCDDVPPEFLDGIAAVEVSPRTVPHPIHAGVYTLGECIALPVPAAGPTAPTAVQSRVVLYYGSFRALAQLDQGFDWRGEAWETLTHELRHHLEWRAHAPDLEALDETVEQNFSRHEGEAFDPMFYRGGEPIADGVYRVDGDYFIEQVAPSVPASVGFLWHGAEYQVLVPRDAELPAYLKVEGVEHPPDGDLVIVLQPKLGLRALFRRQGVYGAAVEAVRAG